MTSRPATLMRTAGQVAATATALLFAVCVAAAATLGGVDSNDLFAEAAAETRCTPRMDATGVGSSFNTIRVDGYLDTCDGSPAKVTVRDASGTALASGTAALTSGSTTMTLSGSVSTNAAAGAAGVVEQLGVPTALATQVVNWKLAELPPPPPAVVFTDNFETFAGWTTVAPGVVVSSTAQAQTGARSGLKDSNNDPAGAWKSLGTTVTDFSFDAWVYRPGSYSGGANDRISLEDSSFNGYGFLANHSGNQLAIERRTGGSGTSLASVTFNPPEDVWYRVQISRSATSLSATAYDTSGTPISSTVTVTDGSYSSFNRAVIRGGFPYYVDNLSVSAAAVAPTTIAVDSAGTLDGTYVGSPTLGVAGLVPADPATAVAFDGVDDAVLTGDSPFVNTTTRPARTVELWFNADTLTGRGILYEEGGSTNGINIYTDGTTLWASAWSQSQSWSNQMSVSMPGLTTSTTYFVTVALDATVSKSLTMYVNGAAVGVTTKTDANPWNTHTDDGAIGTLNGSTRFHDGAASGTGFFFDGTMQNVSLFNTAHTAQRVTNTWLAAL